jgi:hypothetical protein
MKVGAAQNAGPKLFEALKGSHIRDENLHRIGKRLVYQIHILLKTAHIHLAGNVALNQPAERVVKTVAEIDEWHGEPVLRQDGDHLYLDDFRLKMDLEGYIGFTELMADMRKRGVGGIRLDAAISVHEVIEFARLWATGSPSTLDELSALLRERGVSHVALAPPASSRGKPARERESHKAVAKRTYFRTISAVSEVMESVKLKQAVGVRKSKRVVQGLVDLMLQDENTLLGLATLRSHDEYTYSHCVNVCILALSMATAGVRPAASVRTGRGRTVSRRGQGRHSLGDPQQGERVHARGLARDPATPDSRSQKSLASQRARRRVHQDRDRRVRTPP